MQSINKFVIDNIAPEVSAEYIGYKMYKLGVAKIKSVTIGNVVGENKLEYQRSAMVTVDQWCETESAYDFLKKMKDSSVVDFRLPYRPNHTWYIIRCEDFEDCYGYLAIKSFALFDKNYYDMLERRIKMDVVDLRPFNYTNVDAHSHERFNMDYRNVTLRRHQAHFVPTGNRLNYNNSSVTIM
jgi:hypothetical protein